VVGHGEGLKAARDALGRGDPLIAYDLASVALTEDPGDLEAAFLVALALARSGAESRAAAEAGRLQALIADDPEVSAVLREDIEALSARLAKDRALAASGASRRDLAAQAAAAYEHIGRTLGRHYSLINAATLWLLAGDAARATELAKLAGDAAARDREDTPYWRLATEAEAALVLNDGDAARDLLARAVSAPGADLAARAVTRRQLALVCTANGVDPAVLDPLALSAILHYCGHAPRAIGASSHGSAVESSVVAQTEHVLATRPVGAAYGSLASGSDIVIAEALLHAGIELHVVLPFDTDEFVAVSVDPAGTGWRERFRACLGSAASVTFACDSSYLGDDVLFGYAAAIAMGHALNRATFLGTEALQLAVWDGSPPSGPAGTAHDVARWRKAGRETIVVDAAGARTEAVAKPASSRAPFGREVRGILFTDLRGFSQLRDEEYPPLLEHVITRLADVLDAYGDRILARKSWGDAVHAICTDVETTARACLDIRHVVESLDCAGLGLPGDMQMRVGAHVGPVLPWHDPVGRIPGYWGREMTRTARIEPRTPEGEVYVTDAFAALLALEAPADLRCEYVGRITTAKDFETVPMYRLCAC
jgi:hypothetical protein